MNTSELAPKIRILFADDEPAIRITLGAILQQEGFEVTLAATVPEALGYINQNTYDVLLADLNIGERSDGFTLISAMRRVQPHAVTLILTGYPAFETALEAIRQQVDDYVVKPANVDALVRNIEDKLENRSPRRTVALVRAALLLRENHGRIVEAWLHEVEGRSELARVPLPRSARSDHVPQILEEMIHHVDCGERELSRPAADSARLHGRTRLQQGYTPAMVVEETRILRACIMTCLRDHLLNIDISHLLSDMNDIDFVLDGMLEESIRAFSGESERAA